jgi:hypothetical protein
MQRLARLVVLVVAFPAFPAFAQLTPARESYARSMDTYLGATASDLMRDFGVPQHMYAIGHHDLVLVYRLRSWVGTRCQTQFELKEHRVASWRFRGDCAGDFSGEDLTPVRGSSSTPTPVQAPAAWLGVTLAEVTADVARRLSLGSPRGVLVAGVEPQSPALGAGLTALDVITAIDATPVNDVATLQSAVAARRPGDSVVIAVLRGGKVEQQRVTLAARPAG